MKLFTSIAFLLWLLLPQVSHATVICPWITSATAFGVLDSSADSSMNDSQITQTACIFSYKDPSAYRSLSVTVETKKDPEEALKSLESQCGKDSAPLCAIGNEAMICSSNKNKIYGEKVYGRVRENVFTVELKISAGQSPSLSKNALEEKTKLIAELVAGNLF